MKGSYTIKIRNRRVTYTLTLERNITVICGNSGTGKTTLIQSISYYEELGEKSGVHIDSPRPCRVLTGKKWAAELEEITASFIFIDEGNAFITTGDFARAIMGTDNYYIIVTRENLYQLPYSVSSILELKKSTSRFKHTYNRTYPLYDHISEVNKKLSAYDAFLTEDSNSGNDFFSHIAERFHMECISAGGKSRILDRMRAMEDKKQIVVCDGAAFGAEMADVHHYYKLHESDILLYLPESFEWLILSSGIIEDPEISEILKSPSDHIDSTKYMSWEQYFSDVLNAKTAHTPAKYTKRRLNDFYLRDENVERIVNRIES